ncbi:hypothetical protein SFRURICE_017501 [Spodoptera frugiperda]|nr:hypothetical protein SFRURICE_017501 [Spodoptera frugiperda]
MFTLNRSNSLPTLPANNDSDAQTEDTKSTCDKENSSVPWQKDKVPPKRQKRKETSPIHRSNTKKSKNATTFAVPTHNTFDILNSEEIEETAAGTEYVPKPEPIFVTGVMDVTALKATINKIVDNKSYIMTTLRSGHIIKQQTKLQNIPDVEKSPDRLELMFAKFQQIMINMMDKMMDRMIQLVSSLVTK